MAAPARVRFPQLALLDRPPVLDPAVAAQLGPLLRDIGPLRHAVILEAMLAAMDSAAHVQDMHTLFEAPLNLEVAGLHVNALNFARLVATSTVPNLVEKSEAVIEACRRMRRAARKACAFQSPDESNKRYTAEKKYRERNGLPSITVPVIGHKNTMQNRFVPAGFEATGTWVSGTIAGVPVVTGVYKSDFEGRDTDKAPGNRLTCSLWANVATSDAVLRTRVCVPAGTEDTVARRLLVNRGIDSLGENKDTKRRQDPKAMAGMWRGLDEEELDEIPVAIVMQILLTAHSRDENQLMLHERSTYKKTWPNDLKLYPAVDRWTFCRSLPITTKEKRADYSRPGLVVLTERVYVGLGGTQTARFAHAAALALLRLHGQRFCHNNIVPWAFARVGDDVVLCDLAFIRPFTAGPAPHDPPTFDDELRIPVPGAHNYCAPESLRGVFDTRSDVYMLGRTLYALITGLTPVAGAGIAVDRLRAAVGGHPLDAWIEGSQNADPDARPTLVHLVLCVCAEYIATALVSSPDAKAVSDAPGPGDQSGLWGRSGLRHSLGSVFCRDVDGGGDLGGDKKKNAKAKKPAGKKNEEEKAEPVKKNKKTDEGDEEKAKPAKKKKEEEEKAAPAKKNKDDENKKRKPKDLGPPPAKRAVINLDDDGVPGPAAPVAPAAPAALVINVGNKNDLGWDVDPDLFSNYASLQPAFDFDQGGGAYPGDMVFHVQPAPDLAIQPVPAPFVQSDLLPSHPPQRQEPAPAPAPASAPAPAPAPASAPAPVSALALALALEPWHREKGDKDLQSHAEQKARLDAEGAARAGQNAASNVPEGQSVEEQVPFAPASVLALAPEPAVPVLGEDLNMTGDAAI